MINNQEFFGKFYWFCKRAKLPICGLLSEDDPYCFARNISIGNFLLFQPGNYLNYTKPYLLQMFQLSS